MFPRLFVFILTAKPGNSEAQKLRTSRIVVYLVMGILKGIWNAMGDLYDSVENTSDNDYYEDNNRYTRVTWEGYYRCIDGFDRPGALDEILPREEAERLMRDERLKRAWIKKKLYDCEHVPSISGFHFYDVK